MVAVTSDLLHNASFYGCLSEFILLDENHSKQELNVCNGKWNNAYFVEYLIVCGVLGPSVQRSPDLFGHFMLMMTIDHRLLHYIKCLFAAYICSVLSTM